MICPECGKRMKSKKGNYDYVESGLDNVVLVGIPFYVCECGEELPVIPQVEELHRAIARVLVKKPALLTGKEVKFLRKRLGLKAVQLAQLLGVPKSTVSRWESAKMKKDIGKANDRLIRSLYILGAEEAANTLLFRERLEFWEKIKDRVETVPIRISQKDIDEEKKILCGQSAVA